MDKRIFLSCVTSEFEPHRILLTKDLRRTGIDLRVQEDFGVLGRTTLEKLDAYIRQCNAVIHLIGYATGACPEVPAVQALLARYPELPEKLSCLTDILEQSDPGISYTQWEAYLAIYHHCELYIYCAGDDAPRGPRFRLDPAQKAAQEKHYHRICMLGRDRGIFETEERLASYVLGDLRNIFPPDPKLFRVAPSKLPTKHDDSVFEGRDEVLADLDDLWTDALADKAGRARIVSLVAIGGAGKTNVVRRWKDALLAREEHGGVERYFDWSFYSQGTRREGDSTSAQTAADATVFVAAALKFFGEEELADSPTPAWDKGARLAELVARYRTLLILDGVEPLQHPPGPQAGELKDDALRALFESLKTNGRGLCVITTREAIRDLVSTEKTTTPRWNLGHLTEKASVAILRGYGVLGPYEELKAASHEVKYHALTLSLMARYLKMAYNPPDISRRNCFRFEDADKETSEVKEGKAHAFRVFAAYERWFEREDRHIELSILRLLGLFDRPATPDCIGALCNAPAIPGLTEPLVGLDPPQWNIAITHLHNLDLIETIDWSPMKICGYGEKEARAAMEGGKRGRTPDIGPPKPFNPPHFSFPISYSLDAHPLLREYFHARLMECGIAPAAHIRLYNHLCASVPFWPEGREGLLSLYQAVAHGCKAGRFDEREVYCDRILRGTDGDHAFYSSKRLGLLGLDLAAVACFFVMPWQNLAPNLSPDTQSWLLNEAAWRLCALNRSTEAREPMRVAMEMAVQQEDWYNAAIYASNLSETELTLGEVTASETTAAKAVTFADDSKDAIQMIGKRTIHADALHQSGQLEASRALFIEAEAMETDRQSGCSLLSSLQGYLYCDLLLDASERAAWKKHLVTSFASDAPSSSKPPEGRIEYEDLFVVERRATVPLLLKLDNRAV